MRAEQKSLNILLVGDRHSGRTALMNYYTTGETVKPSSSAWVANSDHMRATDLDDENLTSSSGVYSSYGDDESLASSSDTQPKPQFSSAKRADVRDHEPLQGYVNAEHFARSDEDSETDLTTQPTDMPDYDYRVDLSQALPAMQSLSTILRGPSNPVLKPHSAVIDTVIDRQPMKLSLMKLPHSQRFADVHDISEFYGSMNAILVCFSMAERYPDKALASAEKKLIEAKRFAAYGTPVLLVATNADPGRLIMRTQGAAHSLAQKYGVPYFETSAVTGENIKQLFEETVHRTQVGQSAQISLRAASQRPAILKAWLYQAMKQTETGVRSSMQRLFCSKPSSTQTKEAQVARYAFRFMTQYEHAHRRLPDAATVFYAIRDDLIGLPLSCELRRLADKVAPPEPFELPQVQADIRRTQTSLVRQVSTPTSSPVMSRANFSDSDDRPSPDDRGDHRQLDRSGEDFQTDADEQDDSTQNDSPRGPKG